jgi:TRAP-type C4-dicarboxylate transport system substrate-binding protein
MASRVSGGVARARRAALAAAVAFVATAAPAKSKEVLKLATLAPQGSVWDTTLRAMGAEMATASGGEVQLRLYPGGVAGDESDVVRKMRLGQFQGAALTVTGLAEIEPAFALFHLPMLFDSWPEVDHVLAELRPELERRLAAKGYTLLLWGHGGWVHLFSRQPIRVVGDLKRQKLFAWAGDDAGVQSWRARGYQPVPLAATDVTMGFQTGMIDVVPTTPIAALSLQWFRQTPYMQGLGMAPLVGGVVVRRDAWEKIAAPTRDGFAAAIATAEKTLAAEVPRQDAGAVEQMRARGLTVVELDAAQRAEWRREADEFARAAREGKVPPEILERARAALAAFRAAGTPP